MRSTLTAFLLLLLVITSNAATRCVGPSATGNGSGSDWNNVMAWSSAPARGDVWYLMDGNYATKTFSTALSGTTRITVKKAIQSDHFTDTGWNTTMGDGQAVFSGSLQIHTGYHTFDGQVRNESNWFDSDSYGFRVNFTAQNQTQIKVGGFGTGNAHAVEVKYFFVNSPYQSLPSTTIRQYSIDTEVDSSTYSETLGTIVSRCYVYGGNNPFFLRHARNTTLEYCAAQGAYNNDANHGEVVNLYYGSPGTIVRYNQFGPCYGPKYGGDGSVGTAVIAYTNPYGGGGIEVYGNVFWGYHVGDAVIGYDGSLSSGNKVYNNTFVDGWGAAGIKFGTGTGNVVYNNLWVNCGTPTFTGVQTRNYNGISGSASLGEANQQLNIPTSIFVNYAAKNFRLAAPTAAGISLGSPHNFDMHGNTRSGDGTWDRGAYEFGVTSSNPMVLISPSSLDFGVVNVSASMNLNFTVQNIGAGTLAGTATVAAPYSIVSGGTYSLGASQSQSVTVRYTPVAAGSNTQIITFTGGGGMTATVRGAADAASPTVTLTAPANGLTASNSVNLTATANDDIGVAGVRFFVSGVLVLDDTASPYSYAWDSRSVANGTYSIYAQARDGAGKLTWSGTNLITVSNVAAVLPGPGAYWSFNEVGGNQATDSVATNTLTLRNGATWSGNGKFSGGLLLDGVNDYADALNSPGLDINGNTLSVAAWVKLDNKGTWQQILVKVKETGAFTSPYFAWHLFGGHVSTAQWSPQFQVVNSSGSGVNVGSSANVNYGEWVHMVGVYDGSAVRLYVNGVDRGSAALTGNVLSYNQPLYVGAHGMPGEFTKGVIDEVRIYSVALSASQVQGLYQLSGASRPPAPTGLYVLQN